MSLPSSNGGASTLARSRPDGLLKCRSRHRATLRQQLIEPTKFFPIYPLVWCGRASTDWEQSLPSDKIFLHRLAVLARVGCRGPDLRALEVDLEASIDLGMASSSDNLSDTANYANLARDISDALEGSLHSDFAEAADAAAAFLLLREPRITEVFLTLREPRAIVDGAVGEVGVSVTRKRCSTE